MQYILIKLIDVYRYCISPLTPPNCRFTPTCSQYAREAIFKYGAMRGCWLSIHRIIRCNPWSSGGYDPIPEDSYK